MSKSLEINIKIIKYIDYYGGLAINNFHDNIWKLLLSTTKTPMSSKNYKFCIFMCLVLASSETKKPDKKSKAERPYHFFNNHTIIYKLYQLLQEHVYESV